MGGGGGEEVVISPEFLMRCAFHYCWVGLRCWDLMAASTLQLKKLMLLEVMLMMFDLLI